MVVCIKYNVHCFLIYSGTENYKVKLKYADEQKEHIRHCFDYYCKKTIRYQAITLYRESAKYAARNVSFEDIPNDYFSECGECDTYPILLFTINKTETHTPILCSLCDRLNKMDNGAQSQKRNIS